MLFDHSESGSDTTSECQPLLQEGCHPQTARRPTSKRIPRTTQDNISGATQRRAVALCLATILLVEVGVYLQLAPLNLVMENIICDMLHPCSQDSSSKHQSLRCKSADVQDELAKIKGWQMTFDYIPSLLLSVPYGVAADRYGRKPILSLSLLGFLLQWTSTNAICWWSAVLPLRLTWLTSGFLLIGGGSSVLNAQIFTIIADVTPEQTRSTAFFYIVAAALLGEVIASPLASVIMQRTLWLPIGLGLVFLIGAQCIVLALPETRNSQVDSNSTQSLDVPADLGSGSSTLEPANSDENSSQRQRQSSLWTNDLSIIALLSVILVTSLGRYAQEVLLQLITKRYSWTWAEASYLLSLRALTSLVLLTLIAPVASYLLVNKVHLSPKGKDVWLARASALALALGAYVIGFAESPPFAIIGLFVYALGAGFSLLVRSVLTTLVHPNHVSALYNVIGVLDSLSSLVAGPLLSMAFRTGIRLDGVWVGLPFIGAGVLFSAAAFVLMVIKPDTPMIRP